MMNTFDIMDYGAVGDGITDDSAAIQAAINAAQSVACPYFGTGGKVISPPGLAFRLGSGLTITKPVAIDIQSLMVYSPTSGVALTIGAAGWQQYHDIKLFGILAANGNTGMPSGVIQSGTTGIKVTNFCFSRLRCDILQGFTNCGIDFDAQGASFAPQVIQHNRIDLGQVVNNGIGIRARSLNAATSSMQANFVHTINCYQSFFGFVLDEQNVGAATDSNYFIFDSIDNANQAAGGQGGVVNGRFNRIDITYLGCNIWFGATSAYNTLNLYNTAATQATYTAGGSGNKYNTI